MNEHTITAIARVCHEVNAAYCRSIGDSSQPSWEEAPEWQRESAIAGVKFHTSYFSEKGSWPEPDMSHKSWLLQKEQDGWKYGPVKDPLAKTHPCYVPYSALPAEQKAKDFIFGAIIKALAENPPIA